MNKIKVIIADDNMHYTKNLEKYLNRCEKIDILDVVSTDEEEIKAIEELKPDIVITDLRRNEKDSGLDIIKEYESREDSPIFFVISGSLVPYLKNVAAFMFKPVDDYDRIIAEINRIYEERINIDNNEEERKRFVNQNIGPFRRLLNNLIH